MTKILCHETGSHTTQGLCCDDRRAVTGSAVPSSFPPACRTILNFRSLNTVQQTCIPQAMLGGDIICQAEVRSLGKTAVFVLTSLQQVEPVAGESAPVLVMCHTRELAFQIRNEYNRFSKYMPDIKTHEFYGGTPHPEGCRDPQEQGHSSTYHRRHPSVVSTPWCVISTSASATSASSFSMSAIRCSTRSVRRPRASRHHICESRTLIYTFRYAPRCAGDLQGDTSAETGHDVLCHTL